MGVEGTKGKGSAKDMKETKKIIADTFKQIGLIDETYTGEITIGITNGGVMFIRKSETLR